MSRREKVILPVWHDVSRIDVQRFSPALADRLAVDTEMGIEAVAEAILKIVRPVSDKQIGAKDPLGDYEFLYPIHYGHYGTVFKCKLKRTGEICILKQSSNDHVCFETLEELAKLHVPNLAAPTRVWQTETTTFEVLPYVGGIRLSRAVIPGTGGLTGSVLESCHMQLMNTLGELHAAGIVHRDVHPDNVYLIVEQNSTARHSTDLELSRWHYGWGFGTHLRAIGRRQGFLPQRAVMHKEARKLQPFRLAWVLVDCSFAARAGSETALPFRHGSFTPEEQAHGKVQTASDMYSLGATLYFGITGKEFPSYQNQRHETLGKTPLPKGGHASVGFPSHLESLLSLEPGNRPSAITYLQLDTISSGYTGSLKIDDDLMLLCDHFDSHTALARMGDALSSYEEELADKSTTQEERAHYARLIAFVTNHENDCS